MNLDLKNGVGDVSDNTMPRKLQLEREPQKQQKHFDDSTLGASVHTSQQVLQEWIIGYICIRSSPNLLFLAEVGLAATLDLKR